MPRLPRAPLARMLSHAVLLLAATGGAIATPPILSEIRVDSLGPFMGTEFIEIAGPADLALDGYALVVLGDADDDESSIVSGDSGVVESVVLLDGLAIPADRALLIHSSPLLPVQPDAVATLHLEDADNLTILLVEGCTCVPGDDLDTDDDGVLDAGGWKRTVDAVAFVEATEGFLSEWTYAEARIESEEGWFVFAASRCLDTGAWHAGPPEFDAAGPDSPGISNPPCAGWLCTADITSDGAVDAMDLARLLGDWGAFGTMSDLDGDALVDARDLAILLANWGPCDL